MSTSLLMLAAIEKHFGGIPALRGAGLELRAGEIHGLVGENGAGKSTLINIATGVLQPDAGSIVLDGETISLASPRHAAAQGIAVVHQEADLFPQLSVAENMLLRRGLIRRAGGWLDWRSVFADAERLVAAMGERFDVRAPASDLSVARRMMAEIAAAVSENARILFLDEPTASLTTKEIDRLFEQLRRLRESGVAIVYVSHRLDEVLRLCDRVTIMRDGATVGTHDIAEMTVPRMVGEMVGREPSELFARHAAPEREIRCRVQGLTDVAGAFRDVSFEIRAGEILGLYGFVGAGRSELAQTLFGLRTATSGTVHIGGKAVNVSSPRHALASGIAYLPEDRLVQGVFRGHGVRTNATIAVLRRLCRGPFIRTGEERALAVGIAEQTQLRARSIEQPIGTLSGGNQQKVVFGRWESAGPKLLILDEPTRGVDVGAKAELHRLIAKVAERGTAVLLISSELPEVMAMSDRVLTLSAGRLTGVFDPRVDAERRIAEAAVPPSGGELDTERATQRTNRLLAVRELGLLCFIGIISLAMAAARPSEFANVANFLDILANAALPAIIGMGAMLVICAGGIDISVGAMMGLVASLTAMASKAGLPPTLCLALALAMGCACGLANGAISLAARIHPIIVTLAGISIYGGITRWVTGGYEVVGLSPTYRALADGTLFGIPRICYYVVAVTAAIHVVLNYRVVGRHILALGDSQSAARMIGISRAKVTLIAFGVSGALVGLAALLHTGYYGKAQSNTGEGMELMAIAAAVIGGTNILGGRGSAIGTLLGAFLAALLYNILILLQIHSYWQNLFVGGLILLAVIVDVTVQRRREARR